jgi:excisionase family DNA binding protein
VSIPSTGLSDVERKRHGGGSETPRITVSVEEAARISGLGESTIRRLAYQGKLRSARVLARRLIFLDSLHDLLSGKEEVKA